MKAILLTILLGVFSTLAHAEDWTTSDGINYKTVRVVKIEDDAVTIIYKDGGALIPLSKLPPALQERFDYNAAKAKAAAELRAKSDAESAKELQAEIDLAQKLKREQQIKDADARGQSVAK